MHVYTPIFAVMVTWPEWLDRDLYPFAAHRFAADGGEMHYVDEGEGPPVVFVHGNPTWSFQFRTAIRELSPTHRCVAPDHLGFGLSDKPAGWSYRPTEHAANFARFMADLDLTGVTLVVGDWGGPIGLSWALDHPERVRHIVITNTWFWSVRGDLYYWGFSTLMGGPVGRFLIRRRNAFARDVLRAAFADKTKLTPQIHEHYLAPLADPGQRTGTWVLPRHIMASSGWLSGLWRRRSVLAGIPMSVLWGTEDIAFRDKELRRWAAAFPHASVDRLPVGHFIAEEDPQALIDVIRAGGDEPSHRLEDTPPRI
jgi:haloalkane dehalogenase